MRQLLSRNIRRDRRGRNLGNHVSNTLVTYDALENAFINEYGISDEELNAILVDAKLKGINELHIRRPKYEKVVTEAQARRLAEGGLYVTYHRESHYCYISLNWQYGPSFEVH